MRLGTLLRAAPCPDGFRVASLADENDLTRLDRVLWRGFDHRGEPPAGNVPLRARARDTPDYRKELDIVVIAPDGS
jgi:hypothetical protein